MQATATVTPTVITDSRKMRRVLERAHKMMRKLNKKYNTTTVPGAYAEAAKRVLNLKTRFANQPRRVIGRN